MNLPDELKQMPGRFLTAFTFFTRIPVPVSLANDETKSDTLGASAIAFPLAGLAIGLILALVYYIATLLLPVPVAALIAVIAGVLITGALHEDGLADCADGFGAGSDRTRILEIMRDSRIGTYGTLALISSVTLRWVLLTTLPVEAGIAALILTHAASRTAMLPAIRYDVYARPEGLGKSMSASLSGATLGFALGICLVVCLIAGGLAGPLAMAAGLLAAWGLSRLLTARIGGYTGDTLGAMEQVAEVVVLAVLVGAWA